MRTSIPGKLDHLPERSRLSAFNGYHHNKSPLGAPEGDALAPYADLNHVELLRALRALGPCPAHVYGKNWLSQMARGWLPTPKGGTS